MRRGIGRLRAGNSASTDADAAAWAAAVTGAGGTYSAATLAAVSAFVVSAKASNYWTKLNRINLFCGNQLAAALVPLKVGGGSATDTNVNFVAGDYTEATGLTGNGTTKYLDTGLVPSVSLTLNDTHNALYNRSSTLDGRIGSYGTTGATATYLYAPVTGAVFSDMYTNVGGAGRVSAAITTPYGFLIGSRVSAVSHAIYRNGSSLASNAATAGALAAFSAFVGAINAAGAASEFTSCPMGGYSIGSGLTAGDVTAYNTHMQAFQLALSRNV